MAKVLKSRPKIRKKSVSGKKVDGYRRVEWACVGADVSMSSIALAVIAKTTEGKIRTGTASVRWSKDHDYFDRLKTAAKPHDLMHELFINAKLMPELEDVYIAVEEAVPIGMLQRGTRGKVSGLTGAWMKQQIQISGAFLGGLVRYGWKSIYEIQSNQWQALVAHDLGITTHHTKWSNAGFLALPPHVKTSAKSVGKYRAQQWVEVFHPKWDGHWPDIIADSKLGQISRPEGRTPQGIQSDDRYEALGIANWMKTELKRSK